LVSLIFSPIDSAIGPRLRPRRVAPRKTAAPAAFRIPAAAAIDAAGEPVTSF
jgi:hypothetical protein